MQKTTKLLKKQPLNIVWLKRDLRSQDHAPLLKAECAGIPYIIIYLFEPSRIEYPDTGPRHLQFVYHSISTLDKVLNNIITVLDDKNKQNLALVLENLAATTKSLNSSMANIETMLQKQNGSVSQSFDNLNSFK